ncbi:hypothetical protein M404DRAFT_30904 [Pisolithus tinctorius Marx 270]|uniref:Uncharacterized protein n=1 Tax=Pisolithus tinctorius Marx 270 TaxID=870435 RepID=A0A0C3IPS3_PISTI|nr:hypothetical protein M404DRAFT_30904 [Pisolithus tinctorius Marx 270]
MQGKGKEKATEMEEADDKREIGGEDEPVTPLEGPSGAGVHTWWVEWEREWQLQAMERQAEAHETTALAFKRMAEAVEQMAVAAEQTTNKWRWRMEEAEDKNEEADEGAEGDNEEEEDVRGEKEGGEEQEGGGEQAMEE